MYKILTKLKILHITSWFPNKNNPKEAPWIDRHIEALNLFCENEVWHIRTIENSPFKLEKYTSEKAKHRLFSLPTSRWFFIELITFFQLFWFALTNGSLIKESDVINFHIAYPSLTYWKLLKPFFKNKPVVITEHWSAYHFNFGVQKPLPKAQNIFKQNLPVISVSKALINDIEEFSKASFPFSIVSNVVDIDVFYLDKGKQSITPRFFMVSQWNAPKDPFAVINAFKKLLLPHPKALLIIGGYGNQIDQIKALIESENLKQNVNLIGLLNSDQIAEEMNKATAFIHNSKYETFSVVCAEAICCGCPVVASNVGGIKEFVIEENGVLYNSADELLNVMNHMILNPLKREPIAVFGEAHFSYKVVGDKYFKALKNYANPA